MYTGRSRVRKRVWAGLVLLGVDERERRSSRQHILWVGFRGVESGQKLLRTG